MQAMARAEHLDQLEKEREEKKAKDLKKKMEVRRAQEEDMAAKK